MIIAHLSDLHLGYRAYGRLTPGGVNQREVDIAAACAEAMETVVRLRPDLVLLAGDVFHSVRPSNAAIAEAFRRLASLASRLAGVPVVVIAGDRDTPRSTDTATILTLFREIPGVIVVTDDLERVRLESIDTEVLAVPHAALRSGAPRRLEPGSTNGAHVLLMHAMLRGPRADRVLLADFDDGGAIVDEGAFDPEEWDYVALGHHPLAVELAPNTWYSGGPERTSPDVWAEVGAPKGFLSYDTSERRASFHPVSTREVLDLPPICARGKTPREVDAAVASALAAIPGGAAGRIIRLVLSDVPRGRLGELDHRQLRSTRAEALHFLLEPRPPRLESAAESVLPARGLSLEKQLDEYLARIWQPTSPGIDRGRLVALGRGYLEQAAEAVEP